MRISVVILAILAFKYWQHWTWEMPNSDSGITWITYAVALWAVIGDILEYRALMKRGSGS